MIFRNQWFGSFGVGMLVLPLLTADTAFAEGPMTWQAEYGGQGALTAGISLPDGIGYPKGTVLDITASASDSDWEWPTGGNIANGMLAADGTFQYLWIAGNGGVVDKPYDRVAKLTLPNTYAIVGLNLTVSNDPADEIGESDSGSRVDDPVTVTKVSYSVTATLSVISSGTLQGVNRLDTGTTFQFPDGSGDPPPSTLFMGKYVGGVPNWRTLGASDNTNSSDLQRIVAGWYDYREGVAVFYPPFMPPSAIDGGVLFEQTMTRTIAKFPYVGDVQLDPAYGEDNSPTRAMQSALYGTGPWPWTSMFPTMSFLDGPGPHTGQINILGASSYYKITRTGLQTVYMKLDGVDIANPVGYWTDLGIESPSTDSEWSRTW